LGGTQQGLFETLSVHNTSTSDEQLELPAPIPMAVVRNETNGIGLFSCIYMCIHLYMCTHIFIYILHTTSLSDKQLALPAPIPMAVVRNEENDINVHVYTCTHMYQEYMYVYICIIIYIYKYR
jgi:hypothetical protein